MQTWSAIKFAKIKAEEAEREVRMVGVAVAKMIEWGATQVIQYVGLLSKYHRNTVHINENVLDKEIEI